MIKEKPYLLEMQNISKAFAGNLVLKKVCLHVQSAEVLAFLGENGAGKSTMIKILAGIYSKDAGRILFGRPGHQREIENASSICTAKKRPIAFIHQDLGLIDWMTIAENMALSLGFPQGRFHLIDWKKVAYQAEQALAQVGVFLSPRKRIFQLSQAEKAIVAIARALAIKAELLVLDEPTASLPAEDVDKLFAIIQKLQTRGVGMIYVTHRMDEVAQIASRVLIIRDGSVVEDAATNEISAAQMVEKIVGRAQIASDHTETVPQDSPKAETQVVLELENFATNEVGPLSFQLQKGELLGLVGLRGAGHEQIGRSLFGMQAICNGRLYLQGKSYSLTANSAIADSGTSNSGATDYGLKLSPNWAIGNNISLLAANRGSESLVLSMSLQENLFLNLQNHGYRAWQLYRTKQMLARSRRYIRQLSIVPGTPNADIAALSGGNQQKVVLSRWLDIDNDIMILEDPTAGVDVGARAEIYQIFQDILAQGKSLLLISTDFQEVAKICSRVLVFNKCKISCELVGENISHQNIFLYASQ